MEAEDDRQDDGGASSAGGGGGGDKHARYVFLRRRLQGGHRERGLESAGGRDRATASFACFGGKRAWAWRERAGGTRFVNGRVLERHARLTR